MLAKCLSVLLTAALFLPVSPAARLRTGTWLRLHVVAQDDTEAMQAVKAPVRDAVQAVYRDSPVRTGSMLADAALLLPQLTDAARNAAAQSGFPGEVRVCLGLADSDARTLNGCEIPAGRYPALQVMLGDAQGRNWWGLLDPDAALAAAAIAPGEGAVEWDWSLEGFLCALLGRIGGHAHAE